ncbi:von Willebrand factor A domain-containing protein 7-like [Gadus chalcogrammus]|uniref:von Willebrand factor A domain-containing protein 7-like n=1 Tax=Gadus chalcogrammus TaxID=1042646 RepID=UPI0024C3E96F|nr:von Willebrand factor A domain-containing protein 7-like [Gadus chalcogrammus]
MCSALHALALALALSLALLQSSVGFVPTGSGAATHASITKTALLQKLKETCQAVADSFGYEFNPTGPSAEELVRACLGPTATGEVSAAKFPAALREVCIENALVDLDFVDSAPHHFNSEAFLEGRGLITEGVVSIKANIQNHQASRKMLGRVLHTLQDFYSHSNWVELGNTEPFANLIQPNLPIENIAAKDTATCSDCASGNCPNTILANILQENKLTSGYMGISSSKKPKGKCSHGGAGDLTSAAVPRGGISKDECRPGNEALHDAAVTAATSASLQLLEDIRGAAGDRDFLRLMGIDRSLVLCFVIDTTGSMSDDIAAAKDKVYNIIDSTKGTQDEPSEYILVPFNDPDFGPLTRTTDPKVMKNEISKLTATGGGDEPEMCYSGLQMALTAAPAFSHIFVFTDATAKDIELKDTISALISSTKSTVVFFITTTGGRKQRSVTASFNDYTDLALASGGQAIHVTKRNLPEATGIILDTSTSALVTVLQRSRSSGSETFTFLLDESMRNITLYITGSQMTFTISNPAGVSQSNTQLSGGLGTIQSVGNLWRIRLDDDKQTGTWKIQMASALPYTLKVTGQNTITFIYDYVHAFKGPHPGYAPITGRPQAGRPVMLLLSVMGRKGPASVTVGEVGLIPVSRAGPVSKGSTTDMGNGDILVTVDAVPQGEFVVILTGTDSVSGSQFQRQSTTQMSVSKVIVTAVVDSSVEPGQMLSIPFSVMTEGSGGPCSINARNDREFPMTFPMNVPLTTGQYANGTLTITPPKDTPSGTDVTLTIMAKTSASADSNYAVLRLSVVTKITDFVRPTCKVVRVAADDCPTNVSQCASFRWNLSANVTDGNGTGIDRITLRQGNGVLPHDALTNLDIEASYNASCCSQIVEIVAVDKVGNVGTCYHSIAPPTIAPPVGPTPTVPSGGPPPLGPARPLWVLCLLLAAWMARS